MVFEIDKQTNECLPETKLVFSNDDTDAIPERKPHNPFSYQGDSIESFWSQLLRPAQKPIKIIMKQGGTFDFCFLLEDAYVPTLREIKILVKENVKGGASFIFKSVRIDDISSAHEIYGAPTVIFNSEEHKP